MKKFLTKALALAMLSTTLFSTPLFATDDFTRQESVPSTFNSSSGDIFGYDLTVSIPKVMDLNWDVSVGAYDYTDVVYAKGMIAKTQTLKIASPATCNYVNGSDTVVGDIAFGAGNVQTWNADQLYASNTTLDNRNISIVVPKDRVKYTGKYTSTISFNVDLKTN